MIEDDVERTEKTLGYLKTLAQDPSTPEPQSTAGRPAGLTAKGQVGFEYQLSDKLSDFSKRLLGDVLEDLGDTLGEASRESANVSATLEGMLTNYRDALTADKNRIDAHRVYRAAKKLREVVRAEKSRDASDFEECHYKSGTRVALEGLEQSHNAFAATVPGLVAKDRAGLDPAERPETGAVEAALPLLDMAANDKKVFDDSPFLLKQEFRVNANSGPEIRDQTEDLYSLMNLLIVMTAVAHAEVKQADPKVLVDATKTGKERVKFTPEFWVAAGAGTTVGGIGAALAVKAFQTELIAFATKMPGTKFWVELINYVAKLVT